MAPARVSREATIARILIIDDDDDLRLMMCRVLKNAGHDIMEAADGVDGMRKFRAESPAIVITDIVMPHRDGLEMIREIRYAGSQTGIIAISPALWLTLVAPVYFWLAFSVLRKS